MAIHVTIPLLSCRIGGSIEYEHQFLGQKSSKYITDNYGGYSMYISGIEEDLLFIYYLILVAISPRSILLNA